MRTFTPLAILAAVLAAAIFMFSGPASPSKAADGLPDAADVPALPEPSLATFLLRSSTDLMSRAGSLAIPSSGAVLRALRTKEMSHASVGSHTSWPLPRAIFITSFRGMPVIAETSSASRSVLVRLFMIVGGIVES